ELRLKAVGADTVLRLPVQRCVVEDPRAGGKVLVGVRPEKISLTHADDADTSDANGAIPEGSNLLTGRIRDAGYLGVSLQYVIDSPVCPEFSVYEQNVERDTRLTPGTEVVLHWHPSHTFALDAAQDVDAGTVEEVL
ncbi:MAG TPA: TOBE domain-containing protein, partial [Streptomyces sp.]|nr:TOBE domain-containing protein [Streptomyces sp.]